MNLNLASYAFGYSLLGILFKLWMVFLILTNDKNFVIFSVVGFVSVIILTFTNGKKEIRENPTNRQAKVGIIIAGILVIIQLLTTISKVFFN